MLKEELIQKIKEMPDDIDYFISSVGEYDDVDIRIFLKPKDDSFYEFYFGM